MPMYEAKCAKCAKVETYVRTVANYLDTPECCGAKMDKVILHAPMGIVDIPAYVSPVSGQVINSRSSRHEDLKRAGCRPWEGIEQERKESDRQKAYVEQAEDKKIESAAIEAWKSLGTEKQRQLETAV